MAEILRNLGTCNAMVVHGEEGLDEITLCGPTRVSELRDDRVTTYTLSPEELGLERCRLEDLRGGTPEDCAAILKRVLQGEKGPKRDVVLINSGAALCVSGEVESVAKGMQLASESIESGKAREKLDLLIQITNGR